MKTEDFERLKAVCEKEGFDIDQINSWVIQVQKKDPWDGVEFAQLVNYIPTTSTIQNQFTSGKIYRISRIYGSDYKRLEVKEDDSGRLNGLDLLKFKPSTESAYIDQLKKEAFEKHNGRLESNKIDHSNMDGGEINFSWETGKDPFLYRKDTDTLYWCGIPIYQSGKWATRVKERVEVNYGWTDGEIMGTETPICLFGNKDLSKSVFRGMNDNEIGQAFRFLASQLEAYLNIKDFECSQNGEIISFHIKPKKGADLDKVESKVRELAQMISE